MATPRAVAVSVVMPCLNEAETVGICVRKAWKAMHDVGIDGEVIVADNGSTDGSQMIALENGARLVRVAKKGYGNALQGGIAAARGRHIIMGDADDSYDFLELPKFYARLLQGYDLVQGCRLPAGGGRIRHGAMPWLHERIGNPGLTWLARLLFKTKANDMYCGMRAFTRRFYDVARPRSPGMEFALEMMIRASRLRSRMTEVAITYHRSCRSHPAHLRAFRDGLRSLRLYGRFLLH